MTTAEPPTSALPATNRRPWQFTLTSLIVVMIALSLVFAIVRRTRLNLLQSRSAAQHTSCRGHLAKVALALLEYHDHYGSFPPAYVADATGKPLHSWRVLILPFIEEGALYQRYNFGEPWDGPNNRKLAAEMPRLFRCPSAADNQPAGETNYVAVVGPGTVWPGVASVSLSQITDQQDGTLLVVETHDSGISWLEPRDLSIHQATAQINVHAGRGICSRHLQGPNVATADGRTRTLQSSELTPGRLQALLTIAGGD